MTEENRVKISLEPYSPPPRKQPRTTDGRARKVTVTKGRATHIDPFGHAVRGVPCPGCTAAVGQPCVVAGSTPRPRVHQSRVQAFRKFLLGVPLE